MTRDGLQAAGPNARNRRRPVPDGISVPGTAGNSLRRIRLDDIGDVVLPISQNAGRFAHEPLASSGPGPNDESDMIESFLQKSTHGAL